jgi:ribosomal-protein-alanine N-acetyltransferase
MGLFDLFKNREIEEASLLHALEKSPPLFRPMDEEDIWGVMAIESHVYQFPWSERIFRDCLSSGYHAWVYEGAGVIVAYGIISKVAASEAHILNICVHPDIQMSGYGRKMVEKLICVAAAQQAQSIFLEVRPSNYGAIRLYERLGFEEIGIRKGYYQAVGNKREDALTMELKLTFQGAC